MRFVVVTGMSGGGKSTALKMLEDAGFYCADNLPVSLIDKFVELIATPNSEITKVALGLDVRAGQFFEDATMVLERLRKNGYNLEVLFHIGVSAILRTHSVGIKSVNFLSISVSKFFKELSYVRIP